MLKVMFNIAVDKVENIINLECPIATRVDPHGPTKLLIIKAMDSILKAVTAI